MDHAKLLAAWNGALRFYSPKTNLFYETDPAECEPASSFADGRMPWTPERAYGRGMENCAILGGVALRALAAAWNRQDCATVRDGIARAARNVAAGELSLATAHGVPGFVARGLCAEDGHSICTLSSRDQFTHFAHGLFLYALSGMASPVEIAEIGRALSAVSDRFAANVTASNDWNALDANGGIDPKGLLKMWNVRPHEAARLPAVYLAAWKVSGERRHFERYEKHIDEALAQTMKIRELSEREIDWTMPGYAFLQTNAALEIVREGDETRRGAVGRAMSLVAEIANDRFAKGAGADGPWLSAAGDLACAVALATGEPPRAGDLFDGCLLGRNGQPPLATCGPARILSFLCAAAL